MHVGSPGQVQSLAQFSMPASLDRDRTLQCIEHTSVYSLHCTTILNACIIETEAHQNRLQQTPKSAMCQSTVQLGLQYLHRDTTHGSMLSIDNKLNTKSWCQRQRAKEHFLHLLLLRTFFVYSKRRIISSLNSFCQIFENC